MEDSVDNTQERPTDKGHIKDVGLLDLRFAKSAEDLSHITKISDVGMILIPENLAGALSGISITDVGGIVSIPQDCKVSCLTGQSRINGSMLAAGDPDTILVIAGQAFVTGDVTSVGYKEIRIIGQLFAPRSGQEAISAKLTQMTGQNFFLPSNPRIIMGSETLGQEYLELLPESVALVIMGYVRFDDDVQRETLQQKVTEIVLMGTIEAPRSLVPLIQVLTPDKMGEIKATA